MLVHERFVFLQMRKTASTFIAEALTRELPAGEVTSLEKHMSWAKIPPEAATSPVLVYVRDPLDWYVSWYHFNKMYGGMPNGYWLLLSQGGKLDFADTLKNMFLFSKGIMGGDLYSSLFRNLVCDGLCSKRLTVGRYESLFDDLELFLADAGVALPAGAMERARAESRVNASRHGDYRDYYDEELSALVEEWCGPLFGRFGYAHAF